MDLFFKFLPLARRNLLRNRRRTLLTVLSIAASVFLIVVLEGLLRHLDDMPRVDGSEKRLIVRRKTSIKDTLPGAWSTQIEKVPGVHGVLGMVLFWGIYKELKPEYFFPKLAIDARRLVENYPETRVVDPGTGEPRPELTEEFVKDRRGASAGRGLYQRYGWKLGDRIVFEGMGFPDVEMTLRSCYDGPERSTFYFHREYLEELMGEPNAVTFFNVICRSEGDLPSVSSTVDAMFENSEAPTITETEKQFQGLFVSMLGNVHFLMRAIGGACGFAMLFVAANTLAMTARERAQEIAIMKTLGFTTGQVFTLLFTEVGLLCILSTMIGSGGATLLFSIDGPWHDIGNGFLLGFRIPTWLALSAFPIATAVGFLAAFSPFLRIATAPIAAALRRSG